MTENIFGPLVTGLDVQNAATTTLKKWSPTYIAEISHRAGRERTDLPNFASFNESNKLDSWPENQLPALIVIVPGLAGKPVRRGTGIYDAPWKVDVACLASARDSNETDDLVRLYGAVIRAVMIQHPSLEGLAETTIWTNERYDELAFTEARTLGAGLISFTANVFDTIDAAQGPRIPPNDPSADPGNWGIVETTKNRSKVKSS